MKMKKSTYRSLLTHFRNKQEMGQLLILCRVQSAGTSEAGTFQSRKEQQFCTSDISASIIYSAALTTVSPSSFLYGGRLPTYWQQIFL